MIYFTSSWDDGSVYDMRLSELLLKYNQKATFFIPITNIENRAVITAKQIRALSAHFEIGAHTLNHVYLTTVPGREAAYQVKESKKALEAITGASISGFCFPGGKYSKLHVQHVLDAGFEYARTINMFKSAPMRSCLMDTTLQAHNHAALTYFKHLLKRGNISEGLRYGTAILNNNRWDQLLDAIIDDQVRHDSPEKTTCIHLWGHSWEIQENNTWHQLELFLQRLQTYPVISKTNLEIARCITFDGLWAA